MAILEGTSHKDIAEKYGLSTTGIWRHRTNHMSVEAREAINGATQGRLDLPEPCSPGKQERLGQTLTVYDEFLDIRQKTIELYDKAATSGEKGRLSAMASALSERRAVVNDMVKLSLLERGLGDDGDDDKGDIRQVYDQAVEELVERVIGEN
jgi:hypothetical protein